MNGGAASALGPCPHCGENHAEDVLICPTTTQYLPLQGRTIDGKYRFEKLLGEGGMGSVWKARNELIHKDVAIKLMHPEFAANPNILDRFKKEATAAGRIGSVHICDIYDLGRSTIGPYIVMEMMVGQPLDGLWRNRASRRLLAADNRPLRNCASIRVRGSRSRWAWLPVMPASCVMAAPSRSAAAPARPSSSAAAAWMAGMPRSRSMSP